MSNNRKTISDLLAGNPYPGRGIAVGKSADGRFLGFAYFIMGRSENSRNRILVREGDSLFTRPFDESKVKDPSLIIYRAARFLPRRVIVTNGDQTDTICEAFSRGESFSDALRTRTFEPDAPNYTPRISALLPLSGDEPLSIAILRRDAASGDCARDFFDAPALPGVGKLIHTYLSDGDPLPSFAGEPREFFFPNDIDAFAAEIWNALDEENKISLYVCFADAKSGALRDVLYNKNARKE